MVGVVVAVGRCACLLLLSGAVAVWWCLRLFVFAVGGDCNCVLSLCLCCCLLLVEVVCGCW